VSAKHLYIHVPFCARRCVYCDFSIAVRSRIPVEDYLASLEREWDARHGDSVLTLDTVYLGGGTPSKLGGEGIARLVDLVTRRSTLLPGVEVTLEVNPEDVSADAARAWNAAGVNRVSLGVQSFDDNVLSWMHRTHTSKTALTAVEVLRDNGIDNISIDLIFAAPPTLDRAWQKDVETAVSLELPHLSIYGLTVEPHTPLGRWVARHELVEAPEERFEAEFLAAHAILTQAGLTHYEVSNYGRSDRQSRHNWAYWRRKPYVGLGPSAHEFDGDWRYWNVSGYADWVAKLSSGIDPRGGAEELTTDQVVAEEVYLGLRTTAGLGLLAGESDHLMKWVEAGWATVDGKSTLRVTPAGWMRLDALAADLTLLRSRY
jgi:oxygen-independent coproporphyrinogen III oxidase